MKRSIFDIENDVLLSKREVAVVFRCSMRNVDRMVASGGLSKLKIGGSARFLRSEVIGLIEKAMRYG